MEDALRLVTTPVAARLTGLSTKKLREWTSRRALVPADVRPEGKGCPAKFSWQTILVLRVASLMRERFVLELQAHEAALADLRQELSRRSFIGLWGQRVAFAPGRGWTFDAAEVVPNGDALLLIRLDPHLCVLRDGFALQDGSVVAGQLDLFSMPSLSSTRRGPSRRSYSEKGVSPLPEAANSDRIRSRRRPLATASP
jgi:hypothetical protein